MWTTVNLGDTPKESYKYKPHGPWVPFKGAGKQYCKSCGLLNLNNKFTKWCIDKGCLNDLHSNYQQQRKATGFK